MLLPLVFSSAPARSSVPSRSQIHLDILAPSRQTSLRRERETFKKTTVPLMDLTNNILPRCSVAYHRTHRVCKACGYRLSKEEYFPNHWAKPEGDEFSRCKTCVKAGIFMLKDPDPNYYWVGWPKCPIQVLIERGWSPPRNATPADFSPERIGEIILSMPDHNWLLKNFEICGHYGYGGPDEGLCSMPGCVKEVGLKLCTHCYKHRYCSVEHQRLHWAVHAQECDTKITNGNAMVTDADCSQYELADNQNRKKASLPAQAQHPPETMQMQPVESTSPMKGGVAQSQEHQVSIEAKRDRPPQESGTPARESQDNDNGVVELVKQEDRQLSTRFSFAVLNEYCACHFRESDRQGKRKGLQIGFPGMQCKHCRGCNRKGGRFFPSTIKTMADTKKTLISIQNHLIKCDRVPHKVKDHIVRLRDCHEFERKKQKYGSQKAFFLNIWNRLHGGTNHAIQR